MGNPFLSLTFSKYIHKHPSRSGPVALEEEDMLPGAEEKTALLHKESLGAADECTFDVGVAVALKVAIIALSRNEFLKRCHNIPLNIGVCSLVYDNSCRGVRNVDDGHTILHTLMLHHPLHLAGDVNHLVSLFRADGEFLHAVLLKDGLKGYSCFLLPFLQGQMKRVHRQRGAVLVFLGESSQFLQKVCIGYTAHPFHWLS